MQTATVIMNSRQMYYNRVIFKLLFDNGSQLSYVLRTLVKAFEAETIRTEYLAVGTCGASATECFPGEPLVVDKYPIQSHVLDIAESTKMQLNEFNLLERR